MTRIRVADGPLLRNRRSRTTHFFTHDGVVRAVDGVTLDDRSRARRSAWSANPAAARASPPTRCCACCRRIGRIVGGSIALQRRNGEVVDLATLDPRGPLIRAIRGNEIAMIFQEPMTSLSPVHTIGTQIAEAVQLHQRVGKREAIERAVDMLAQVGIGNPSSGFTSIRTSFRAACASAP